MDHNLAEAVNATETPAEAARPEADAVPGNFETTNKKSGHHAAGGSSDPAHTATSSKRRRIQKRWKERLKVGEHVSFIAEGIKATGTIDAVMPDISVVWIWADGGLGRRMLHPGTGTSIHPNKPVLELA